MAVKILLWCAITASAQTLSPEFLNAVLAATAENTRLAPEFTFDLHTVAQDFDKQGRPGKRTDSTGETYFSSIRNLDIPLVVNGKPRSAKDIEKARNSAYKLMEADARASRQQNAKSGDPHFGSQFDNVRTEANFVFKNCPLSNLRPESLQGRPVYALDFAPCPPSAAYKDPFRHHTAVRGTFWIDVATRNIIACRSWVAATGALWYEEEKQLYPGAEPVWLPRRVVWSFSADPQVFGRRLSYEWQATNPKRFVVTTSETVAEPPR